eukprot:TRINITY_DN17382_c0_g1_i1.p4 TRINITY_DN17382_c0_g1~~TRINITY_DN17382_c0_g1_i1.p4  ORF type:complete len:141 (-),score=28.91 TRINITY_DN17382_c0_g1_i1:191-613(-)
MVKILQICVVFVVILSINCAKRECESTHPKVGCMAELREYFHDVAGIIMIDDDCTFSVNLTYDGEGPDVFWYAAPTQAELATGIIIDPENGLPQGRVYADEPVTAQLPETVSWDDVNFLSVWCRDFRVNFGDADFTDCVV